MGSTEPAEYPAQEIKSELWKCCTKVTATSLRGWPPRYVHSQKPPKYQSPQDREKQNLSNLPELLVSGKQKPSPEMGAQRCR